MKYLKLYESFNPPFDDIGYDGFLLISKDGQYILDISMHDYQLQVPNEMDIENFDIRKETFSDGRKFIYPTGLRLHKIDEIDKTEISQYVHSKKKMVDIKRKFDQHKTIYDKMSEMEDDTSTISMRNKYNDRIGKEDFNPYDFNFMEVFNGIMKKDLNI